MNNRLRQFLDVENISQSSFADTINVARASVSHILSGRNNPSYDFIKAIMSAYPRLSMEWLMFGRGKMYNDMNVTSPPALPDVTGHSDNEEDMPSLFPEQQKDVVQEVPYKAAPCTNPAAEKSSGTRKIVRITVLYDDGTYQELE